MNFKKHPIPKPNPNRIPRDQKLFLINQALETPKYHRISSEEYLEHFFANLEKTSKKSSERIIKRNSFGLGSRASKKKFNDLLYKE